MAKRGPQREYDADFRSVLASVDRQGRRHWLHVDLLWGAWRRRRVLLALLLISFYLAVPFLTVGGEPFLRLDLAARRYVVLGQTFRPQDMFYLLLFALLAVVGTVTMVSLLGRVFCGWLCPHNVFLEMVFRPIERLLEGPGHRRRLAAQQGRPPRVRQFVKLLLYALVCGVLANTATAIFTGTEAFRWGLVVDPVAHPAAAVFFAFFFSLCLFNFAWFREQTCTIVCPYGRLQAALLDQDTLGVAYDARRGEPRGASRKNDGGCIDCFRCVAVCPTGIDIRNGNQLECIHCTACIDACDDVMDRLGQPGGLVRYASERELAGGRRRLLRPRTFLYLAVLLVLVTVAGIAVLGRAPVLAVLLRHGSESRASTDAAGAAVALQLVGFEVVNRTSKDRELSFSLPDCPAGRVLPGPARTLPSLSQQQVQLVLEVPLASFDGAQRVVTLAMVSGDWQETFTITMRKP